MRVGVVTGLKAEAAIIRPLVAPGDVGVTGGRIDQASSLADALVAGGCAGLVSFGMAGGLVPGLASGVLVLADRVADGGRGGACDGAWVARVADTLDRAGLPVVRGTMAGSAVIVATPAAKAALRDASGAVAVDMESGAVAAAAVRAGLPFLVLRAIADPAERALPPAIGVGLREDGSTDPFAVLAGLARSPGQIVGVIAVARDAARALGALRRASVCLGRGLGAM